MIHMIYMAAGNSRRFGENKLLKCWQGKKLYQHGLWKLIHVMEDPVDEGDVSVREETTVLSKISTVEVYEDPSEKGQCPYTLTVVTQYPDIVDEVKKLIASDYIPANVRKQIQVIYNPDSKYGASYTIKAGLQAISSKSEEDYYLFMVADQPLLSEDSIRKLLEAVKKKRKVSEYNIGYSLRWRGRPGNPCVFPAALLPELMALEGDKGGRTVLKKHDCIYVDIEEEKEFWDIDTVQDLANV